MRFSFFLWAFMFFSYFLLSLYFIRVFRVFFSMLFVRRISVLFRFFAGVEQFIV